MQTAPVRRKSSARAGGAWLLGVSLALALCLLGMLVEPWSARQHGMAGEEPLAKVRAYLREQGMSEVDVQRQGDSLLLGGYLEDNARRLALQRYLDGSGVDYRLEARSMEDIRQGVDFILQKFGYRQILSSNADKPGWVRLNGELAEQDERWARIDALLESEVPGLLGVENQVRVAGSHLRRLERLLADAGLDRQLSFRERGERIELSGTLDEVQLSAFYRLQREFQQEFGNRPSLELLSRGKRASGDELEFTIRSVLLGRVPYVVLGDGQKYPVAPRHPAVCESSPSSRSRSWWPAASSVSSSISKGRCSMMTALETRLSVADGTHAAALRQRLQAALAECRRELARGAGPERFQFLQQQARALEGGLGILSQLTED